MREACGMESVLQLPVLQARPRRRNTSIAHTNSAAAGLAGLSLALIVTVVQVGAILISRPAEASETSLSSLAAKRFPDMTDAERKLIQFVDSSNPHRRDWVYAGPSMNPDDASNQPENAASWNHDRDIRAEMIRWLAADPEAGRASTRRV